MCKEYLTVSHLMRYLLSYLFFMSFSANERTDPQPQAWEGECQLSKLRFLFYAGVPITPWRGTHQKMGLCIAAKETSVPLITASSPWQETPIITQTKELACQIMSCLFLCYDETVLCLGSSSDNGIKHAGWQSCVGQSCRIPYTVMLATFLVLSVILCVAQLGRIYDTISDKSACKYGNYVGYFTKIKATAKQASWFHSDYICCASINISKSFLAYCCVLVCKLRCGGWGGYWWHWCSIVATEVTRQDSDVKVCYHGICDRGRGWGVEGGIIQGGTDAAHMKYKVTCRDSWDVLESCDGMRA